MEMLHAQLVSEQLRYLRVPALRYAPHTAAWLSAESNRTGKTKILFSFGWLQKQISSASGPHGARFNLLPAAASAMGTLRSVSP